MRWTLVLVLVSLVVVGGLYWRARARAAELFAENARALAHLRAGTTSVPATRQTFGEKLSADARSAYERAIGKWRLLSKREKAILGWIKIQDGLEWEDVQEIMELRDGVLDQEPSPQDVSLALSRSRQILSDLREALRSSMYDTELLAEAGTQDEWVRHAMDFASAANVAGVHAMRELAAGNAEAALDLRVLQAAVGQDLARLGTQWAFVFGNLATLNGLNGIREILATRKIEAGRLAQLGREADFLSSTLAPRERVWHAEEVAMRIAYDEARDKEDWLPLEVGLRHWFSHRIAAAEATAEIAGLIRAARATSTLDWRAGANEMEKLIEQLGRQKNPYARSLLINAFVVEGPPGEVAIHTNLLRVAIAVNRYEARNGAWPSSLADLVPKFLSKVPRCPYADTPVRLGEDRIWSDGFDGADDGGKPMKSRMGHLKDGDAVWRLRAAK